MKFVKVTENGFGGAKGLAELNQQEVDEKKEIRGWVVGGGKGLPEEDELRIIEDSDDANSRRATSSVQASVETHRVPPQPQGQVVSWDRFLPVRSLKVLLVESDDSTRHVVTALLRNCCYQVIAVSNGIEAWKILEDLSNHIDLVLTEVVMSGLSGIGLLSKIVNHKSCQNIPVIMMSSYDSMGIVLKCLSEGAADFLVKPIRKNELKNLWQHVWRRCHSSSGSGSESGIRNEGYTGAKSAEASGNNTGSNDEDDNRSFGLQVQDGSDNGSGTQSSWTKRAAEVESPRQPSACDHLSDPPDSTCGQVIYPRSEAFASSWVCNQHEEQDNQLDNVSVGEDLEIGIPRNSDLQLNGPCKKVTLATNTTKNQYSQLDLNLKKDGQNFFTEKMEICNDQPKGERTKQAVNLPGDIVRSGEYQRRSIGSEIPTARCESSKSKDKVLVNFMDSPSLELSLKMLTGAPEASIDVSEQNILRHSELSAFTRYNTGSTANQKGNVGSCSPLNNSSEAAKQTNSYSTPNQNSNGSSKNNDMGSTTNRSHSKPAVYTDKAPAKSTVKCSHQTSTLKSVPNGHISNIQLMASGKDSSGQVNVVLQESGMPQHHHYYDHHLDHSVQQLQEFPAHNDLSFKNMNGTAQQCGSSNTARLLSETNAVNCSLNGSACGSNHGSNLHNGSSAPTDVEGMHKVYSNGVAAIDGADDGSGRGAGAHQNRSAQREAALNKFRQKRKERCFEKRVRYQSRKKLAETRPRVRGQFVRKVQENYANDADS